MKNSWANSGLDLHLERTGGRLRAGLEAALLDAVRTGRLRPGLRLPSSRSLAADLGVARNTVAEAYGQLVAEGWLTARQGSGTRVADRRPEPVETVAEPRPAGRPRPRFDLRPGSPDTSAFPRSAWISAARRALTSAPSDALGYGDPRGLPVLREALAGYLSRARGVRVTPDRVVVCSGFTQGIGLLARVVRQRGTTTVAMEEYGVREHRDIVSAHGLRVDPLPVDGHGAAVDRLGRHGAVVLTPAHQFPIGVVLSPGRRARVVEWARDTSGVVVEDDYDGEFRYDRQPVGAVQALAPGHVVHAGTVSKSLAPGVRLGWLAAPAGLVDEIVAAKGLADRISGALDQLTLAELITSGAYDRHLRRMRLAYRRRRDHLVGALRERNPAMEVSGVAAGMHVLVRLPGGVEEDDVVARAAAHGLALEGLRAYSARDRHPPALVLGYGTPPQHAFTAAVARLTAVLAELA